MYYPKSWSELEMGDAKSIILESMIFADLSMFKISINRYINFLFRKIDASFFLLEKKEEALAELSSRYI